LPTHLFFIKGAADDVGGDEAFLSTRLRFLGVAKSHPTSNKRFLSFLSLVDLRAAEESFISLMISSSGLLKRTASAELKMTTGRSSSST
jgi:hypothetical protein